MNATLTPLNTDSVDVRDVVSSETSLKIIRNDFLEQCPFCGSGTGPKGTSAFSFHSNGYKCFSCDQTGDAIKFIERYFKISTGEAIRYFKSKYLGIDEDVGKLMGSNKSRKIASNKFDTLGCWVMDLFHKEYERDNLTSYLLSVGVFNENTVKKVLSDYEVRTSSGGCIFPYIDKDNRLRTLKMIKYVKGTGKRDKSTFPFYLHKQIMGEDFKYKRCFFGEHLISKGNRLGVVESEKTALVMAMMMPDTVFLATGGKNVLNVDSIASIPSSIDKEIVLYPDHDNPDKRGMTAFRQWEFVAIELKNKGYDVQIDDTLETGEYPFGYDIADVVLEGVNEKPRSKPVYIPPPKQTNPRQPTVPTEVIEDEDLRLENEIARKERILDRENRLARVIIKIGDMDIPSGIVKMGEIEIEDVAESIAIRIDNVKKSILTDKSEVDLYNLEHLINHLNQ